MKISSYKKKLIWMLVLAATILVGCRKSEFNIEPSEFVIIDNGNGTGTITWEKGKEYMLEGRVFVNDGQVLTIEPGAVIRFRRGKGSSASALIIARGGKIMAEGTAIDPIIFTADGDDLKGSVPVDEFGLWGGIAILGAATINTPTGEANVEGIPLVEPRGVFGGDNDDDDSGVLKYVSIRHGGTEIGKDNELNGLTLGGVGRKTVIENIEVIANADDGIEIFGGTVNLKRVIVTYCDDDAIDIDLGYRGAIQFVCLVQHQYFGDRIFEIDGAEHIKTAQPYSLPIIYNVTAFGRGAAKSNHVVTFTDNAGGIIANSIFINQGKGVDIEYSEARHSSFNQWESSLLQVKNSIFHQVNNNQIDQFFRLDALNDEDTSLAQNQLNQYFVQAANRFVDPGFEFDGVGFSPIGNALVIRENIAPLPEGNLFLESAPFIGAFGSYNWVGDWTLTRQAGIIW